MGTAVSEQSGQWVEPEVNYVDPARRFCAYCGRPIARRFWAASGSEGEVETFCTPDHAVRFARTPLDAALARYDLSSTSGCQHPGA